MHVAPKTSDHHPADPGLVKQVSYPAKAVMKAKDAGTKERYYSSRQ
jgi:hypothetical protein